MIDTCSCQYFAAWRHIADLCGSSEEILVRLTNNVQICCIYIIYIVIALSRRASMYSDRAVRLGCTHTLTLTTHTQSHTHIHSQHIHSHTLTNSQTYNFTQIISHKFLHSTYQHLHIILCFVNLHNHNFSLHCLTIQSLQILSETNLMYIFSQSCQEFISPFIAI